MAKATTKRSGGTRRSTGGGRKPRTGSTDGRGPVGSRAFKRAEKAAKEALKDPKKARELGDEAEAKAGKQASAFGDALDDLMTLIRLIRASASGEYREVPKKTMLAAAAAVAYFVMPIDAIPDAIPVAGYLDDVGVLYFVVRAIQNDLDAFRAWEEQQRAPKPPAKKAAGGKAGAGKSHSTKGRAGSASRATKRTATGGKAAASRGRGRAVASKGKTTAARGASKDSSSRTQKTSSRKSAGSQPKTASAKRPAGASAKRSASRSPAKI